jgi:NAD(P)-dependent dehydrogenase (short-subunit alcohol dehydrogenase family)
MLHGKVIVITGGAKGIGRYAAHTIAQAGGTVILVDIDTQRLHQTSAELHDLKCGVLAVCADVRSENSLRAMTYQVVERFGKIDVLINDAGVVPHFNWGIPRWARVRFLEKDFWDRVIQTNLGGTFLCTKYVLPFMEAQHSGHIINLWGGGRVQNHGACAYVVSKDAIRTFTRFVAEEEREWNICVVAISPKQAIATEDAPEEARKRLPGPEILGDGFVLAAEADMELSGKTVEHRNGTLVAVE